LRQGSFLFPQTYFIHLTVTTLPPKRLNTSTGGHLAS
jgi:hypothetical protein